MTTTVPKVPLASIPYSQHNLSSRCNPQPSFSTIKNTSQCQDLCKNIEAYINNYVDTKLPKESQYTRLNPQEVPLSGFAGSMVAGYYTFLSAQALINGYIKVTGINQLSFLIPPEAAPICAYIRKCLCREPKIGESFRFTVANASTNSVFLATTTNFASWSTVNSNNNGWLQRIVAPGQSTTYIIRIDSCVAGSEKYSVIMPTVVWDNVSAIPVPVTNTIPEQGGITPLVVGLSATTLPLLPAGSAYDFGAADPSTGIV